MDSDKFDKFFITLFITVAVLITIACIVGLILLAGFTAHYFSAHEVNNEVQVVQGTLVEVKEMADWLHRWTESQVIGYAAAMP